MRVAREDEFGPVKNAEGVDSPQTAKEFIFGQSARWLRNAGANLPLGARVELDVLLTYEGEGLEERFKGRDIGEPGEAVYIKG
jgi:UDP-N-acetylglucosamine/UDP-N-acetylgalactosamine diphosphorylase